MSTARHPEFAAVALGFLSAIYNGAYRMTGNEPDAPQPVHLVRAKRRARPELVMVDDPSNEAIARVIERSDDVEGTAARAERIAPNSATGTAGRLSVTACNVLRPDQLLV